MGVTVRPDDLGSIMAGIYRRLDALERTGAVVFSVAGLTGSVAASRWVGATATGSPTTGAHLVGDFVIAHTGGIHVCTAAGTPGTWS